MKRAGACHGRRAALVKMAATAATAVAGGAVLIAAPARAQPAAVDAAAAAAYPAGPVRIIVPYPPGGGVDLLARQLVDRLGRRWQKPAIVDNRPGGGTIIGTDFVVKAAPDGLTLLVTSDSSITSNPYLYPRMPFDPIRDLAPVTELIDLYQMVVVHPSVAATSLPELVALAKAKPGQLNYGSYGSGSQPNLLFESLRVQTGAQFTHVPYKGIAPALVATIAGEVQMTMGAPTTTAGYIDAGKLRPVAIGGPSRSPRFPSVPTLQEAGFADTDPRSWFGLFAPRGTPKSVIDRIRNDIVGVLQTPEFVTNEIQARGYAAVGSTPEAFAAFVKADLDYKGRMIRNAGIKVD